MWKKHLVITLYQTTTKNHDFFDTRDSRNGFLTSFPERGTFGQWRKCLFCVFFSCAISSFQHYDSSGVGSSPGALPTELGSFNQYSGTRVTCYHLCQDLFSTPSSLTELWALCCHHPIKAGSQREWFMKKKGV